MNHNTLQQFLSAFADGELTGEESALVRDHLQHCAECARMLQEIQRIRADLRSVALVELRPTFVQQILRTLHQQQQYDGWGTVELFARRLVFALVVIVLFVVGIGSLSDSGDVIVLEPYLSGVSTDSVTTRVLTTGEISKEDLLLAVSMR